MKNSTLLFVGLILMLLTIQKAFSQTEYQLDSIQRFDWDTNTMAFEMKEREHFTYGNGGTKETSSISYKFNGFIWNPDISYIKTYNEFNNIIDKIFETYDPVFDTWYLGNRTLYTYDGFQNVTYIETSYSDDNGATWDNPLNAFEYTYNVDNLVTSEIEKYYDFLQMDLVNLNQKLYSYNGLLRIEDILQTWNNSGSSWDNFEKTNYTNSDDLPIQEDTFFWMGSDWATQAFERHLNTYTSDQLTEKIIQEWRNGSGGFWENTERTTWAIDTNGNIQEILTYDWDDNASTWLNVKQELWYWSEASTVLDLDEEVIEYGKTLQIVPNPASEYFTIVGLNLSEYYNNGGIVIKIRALNGGTVIGVTIDQGIISQNGVLSIDIKNLPSGLYIVGINTANFSITRKLIVNNN